MCTVTVGQPLHSVTRLAVVSGVVMSAYKSGGNRLFIPTSVSYTHLDVYKRQVINCCNISGDNVTFQSWSINLNSMLFLLVVLRVESVCVLSLIHI